METITILEVRIDKVGEEEALDLIHSWLKIKKKRVIVTPNIEFIMAAQKDREFKKILDKSDLSIPDSSRFGWSEAIIREKNKVKRLLLWPLFPLSRVFFRDFPVTTGTDLMEKLCNYSDDWGFRISLLGGREGVADKAAECLKKKYPKIKIVYAKSGGRVNISGESENDLKIPPTDILFVAFGHGKQEKWIEANKDKVDAKIFMGVGGAFDYLSGEVVRAPNPIRNLGLEWLYRLFTQPWRIKRFGSLIAYIFTFAG